MKKFVYFIAVGLAFTVLQVATVEAEDCAAMSTPALVAACWDRQSTHADGAHGGMAPGTTATGVALTIGSPECALSPPAAGCPAGSPGFSN